MVQHIVEPLAREHDFMMLNPARDTATSTAAVEQAIHILRKAFSA